MSSCFIVKEDFFIDKVDIAAKEVCIYARESQSRPPIHVHYLQYFFQDIDGLLEMKLSILEKFSDQDPDTESDSDKDSEIDSEIDLDEAFPKRTAYTVAETDFNSFTNDNSYYEKDNFSDYEHLPGFFKDSPLPTPHG